VQAGARPWNFAGPKVRETVAAMPRWSSPVYQASHLIAPTVGRGPLSDALTHAGIVTAPAMKVRRLNKRPPSRPPESQGPGVHLPTRSDWPSSKFRARSRPHLIPVRRSLVVKSYHAVPSGSRKSASAYRLHATIGRWLQTLLHPARRVHAAYDR